MLVGGGGNTAYILLKVRVTKVSFSHFETKLVHEKVEKQIRPLMI